MAPAPASHRGGRDVTWLSDNVNGIVHHALHTPMMSVTNATCGIIIVAVPPRLGHGHAAITTLSFVAVLLARINVFGVFATTRRMLSMFSRR
jgi:NAD(P) transhydrogenase subunit alpha